MLQPFSYCDILNHMSALILKIVAMVTMTIDHIGEVFSMSSTYRMIGRIAFPLYSLMVVDGYLHIRNDEERLRRYVLFLLITAIISEPLHDICFEGDWVAWNLQNQILQFLIFICGCWVCDKITNPIINAVIWILIIYLNYVCAIGYYGTGIIFLLLLKFTLEHFKKTDLVRPLLLLVCVSALTFGELLEQLYIQFHDLSQTMYYFRYLVDHGSVVLYTFLALPFMISYDGTYGNVPKWFKLLYRYYYPLHLAVLTIIYYLHK